jgi:alkylation response protein AidB-like acyl-CoA dehydrogenase
MSDQSVTESARQDIDAWRAAAATNSFDSDPFFRRLLRRHLGDRYPEVEPRLFLLAEETGVDFEQLVMDASRDENLPTVQRHDADGRAVEEVVFHPAYHEVGRVFWASGALATLGLPGSDVVSGALVYLLDQHGEAGHACPVACTAGAIKLIQRVGTDEQRERLLPSLLSTDPQQWLRAAQFVTEVQGGSDVSLNAVTAIPEPDRPGSYRIHGEKWFCSVADADLFVVSARLEDARPGTRGLGLFLVPRTIDGRPNGFVLRRLKYKLGTRSMATGEIEFNGAIGEAVGSLDHGFKNLVGIVLDTSRVHNALAACGIMRRAFVEAQTFAAQRVAFDHPILTYPAVHETLARMKLRTMTGLATTFRILAMTDRLESSGHNDELAGARRIAVMVNKYWTAVAATDVARDGIEVLGGNGTIEDFSVLPRLYRDAIVVESWEGTHNTLCAQVLRDFATRDLHRPWLRELEIEIDALTHPEIADEAALARELHRDVAALTVRLGTTEPERASAHIRHIVNRMCRLTEWVALLAQAQWDLEIGEERSLLEAIELYRLVELERADPLENERLAELNSVLAAAL